MAWYPKAERREIPPGPTDPPISPRIIVVHTMAGTIEGAERHFRGGAGVEAHFGVATDGRVWQWRDTGWQADAQADGNGYCISVEHEDKGDPSRPLAPAQLEADVALLRWLGRVHGIPMRLVDGPGGRGIGYHRQFDAWNPNRHACPGDVRLAQLIDVLIPMLQPPQPLQPDPEQELSMADVQQVLDRLTTIEQALTVRGTTGLDDTVEVDAARHRRIEQALGDLKTTLAEVCGMLTAGIPVALTPADREDIARLVATRLQLDGEATLAGTLRIGPKDRT